MAVGLDAAIAAADGHVAVRPPRSHSSVLAMLVLVLLAVLASGCATQTPALLAQPPTGLPSRVELADTRFFPDDSHFCGPAALATVLSADGEVEIWSYFDSTRRYDRQRVDIDGLSISGPGGLRSIGGSAWINVEQNREFIRIRVEFRNGVATAIEEPAPSGKKP